MAGTARCIRAAAALLCGVVLATACGEGDSDYEVTSEVVSHQTTQDILVFEPQAEGPWPVVFALHGHDGSGEDMTEIARRLAREGLVVFAPTYRSDLTTNEGLLETAVDVECAYRFARSIASEHGGDLNQPVAFVGWSMGATLALQGERSRRSTRQARSCHASPKSLGPTSSRPSPAVTTTSAERSKFGTGAKTSVWVVGRLAGARGPLASRPAVRASSPGSASAVRDA
jgi:acetyl esterase/lipase